MIKQVKAALEALDPIHRVQVQRCDESGGSGGTGGWLGGCPYGKRHGYSWRVIFESSYYENEVNSETGAYQYHGQHTYIDESPLSLTKAKLTPTDLLTDIEQDDINTESVTIDNIDLSTNLMYFASSPSFNLVPNMKMVIKPEAPSSSGVEALPIVLSIVEVKSSRSVVVSAFDQLSSSLIGQEIHLGSHWNPQVSIQPHCK